MELCSKEVEEVVLVGGGKEIDAIVNRNRRCDSPAISSDFTGKKFSFQFTGDSVRSVHFNELRGSEETIFSFTALDGSFCS